MVNFVVIFGEFEYFPCDATVDVLWGFPVLEILVVGIDLYFVGGVCQQPPPVSECAYNGIKLQSIDIVVSFSFIQGGQEVRNWVEPFIVLSL